MKEIESQEIRGPRTLLETWSFPNLPIMSSKVKFPGTGASSDQEKTLAESQPATAGHGTASMEGGGHARWEGGDGGWQRGWTARDSSPDTILLSLCLHDVLTGHVPTPYAFYGEVCHGRGTEHCE